MIRRLALILALLPACVVHYLVGTCPEGQIECGARCAATCTTCPEGQQPCGAACVPEAADCHETSDESDDSNDESDDPTTTQGDHGDPSTGDPDPCAACDPLLEQCSDAACTCRPGLTRCGATCVDLRTDPDHCDECDRSCNGGVCQAGTCREGCAGDLTDCAGACVEIKQDSLHCGDCATLCAPDEVCLAGTCRAYTPADDCDACPCPACGDGQACCPSSYLDAPVCVADDCGGD